MNLRNLAETLTITLMAILTSMVLYGVFILTYTSLGQIFPILGVKSGVIWPGELFVTMFEGSFGGSFSWRNTLTRAAPLILTALCTALPARLGLIVIGAEGALVLGGLGATAAGLALIGTPVSVMLVGMAVASMIAGGLLIGLVGALAHFRGVNATISSLLITYIAIGVFNYLVEGPMRDPASLNKPSTYLIAEDPILGSMPGLPDVHWGLGIGVACCFVLWLLMDHTTFGFAARMAGGNIRAAQGAGLPVGRLILLTCFLGGAAAGLAGMVEIAAVHRQANASLIAGYGFTGILVSFIARHHPLGIIPAAVLFGGLSASSGFLQRRLYMPDASVQLFMGIIFVVILLFETFYGRFRVFAPREVREAAAK